MGTKDFDIRVFGTQTNFSPFGDGSSQELSKVAFRHSTGSRRHKPSSGWIPPTSYSMEYLRNETALGLYQELGYFGWSGRSGVLGISFPGSFSYQLDKLGVDLVSDFPASLQDIAIQKARANLKASNFQAGQAFAERGQTARTVANTLNRVTDLARIIKRRDVGGLRDFLSGGYRDQVTRISRDFPNAWLEYSYGWKPLLSDIHSAVSALDKKDRTEWMVTAKGRHSSIAGGGELSDSAGSNVNSYHSIVSAKREDSSFVRIDAVPSSPGLATAASLGLTNPLSLAWELLPYSFVVDWALPLGPYFDQLDATLGWEIRGCSVSNLTKVQARARALNYTTSYGTRVEQQWSTRYNRVKLNRVAYESVPFAVLPHFKDPVSHLHVLSALSLLAQAFGR